jgi:hypothetical protein
VTRTFQGALIAAGFLAGIAQAQSFEKPFRLQADGKPIDVEIGHAAPYVFDFDRDGVRDLLVGQFGSGGRLRIYKNLGTDKEPRFGEFDWFKAGGEIATSGAS